MKKKEEKHKSEKKEKEERYSKMERKVCTGSVTDRRTHQRTTDAPTDADENRDLRSSDLLSYTLIIPYFRLRALKKVT